MTLKSIKYLKIDDEKGILYSEKQRILLIPINFIGVITASFSEIFGVMGARKLIYEIGKGLGEGFVKTLESILKREKITLDKEMFIRETYNAICMTAGWGLIEIKEFDLKESKSIIKITNSPSEDLAEKIDFALERGVLAGVYKKITNQEIYYQTKSKKGDSVIFEGLREIPKKILAEGEMSLLGRKELERMVETKTQELNKKIAELEKFYRLTIGRELRIIELKKEIDEFKKQSENR